MIIIIIVIDPRHICHLLSSLLRPIRGAEYCDRVVRLCLCVCLSSSISLELLDRSSRFFVQIPCGRGSVLLRRRCDTLCNSGFMDDVTFGHSEPYGASGVATPGRSLMSN